MWEAASINTLHTICHDFTLADTIFAPFEKLTGGCCGVAPAFLLAAGIATDAPSVTKTSRAVRVMSLSRRAAAAIAPILHPASCACFLADSACSPTDGDGALALAFLPVAVDELMPVTFS